MKIIIFGSSGLAGSGIVNALSNFNITCPTHNEVNLVESNLLENYMSVAKPDVVIMAAGRVGGIGFNNENQLKQFSDNFLMNFNVITACANLSVKKLILVSSSCIYPLTAKIPLTESDIFSGLPEATNEGYALAKGSAIRLMMLYKKMGFKDWICLVPTNLVGFHKNWEVDSHMIPMVINKIRNQPEELNVYGDGSAVRQFLDHRDLGRAIKYVINKNINADILNLSTEERYSVNEVINLVIKKFRFEGKINFNGKLNGHPDKTMSVAQARILGWKSSITLSESLDDILKQLTIC